MCHSRRARPGDCAGVRHTVVVAAPEVVLHLPRLFEVLGLVDAALAIGVDGLVDQARELPVKGRVALHLFGDGALHVAGDGVGLRGRRLEARHLRGEGLAVKDVDGFHHRHDLGGADVAVEQLAHLGLVVA